MSDNQTEVPFGVTAIQKGFVTLEQVVDALGVQAEEHLSTGEYRRIGQILLEQQAIESTQLDEIDQTLEKTGRKP